MSNFTGVALARAGKNPQVSRLASRNNFKGLRLIDFIFGPLGLRYRQDGWRVGQDGSNTLKAAFVPSLESVSKQWCTPAVHFTKKRDQSSPTLRRRSGGVSHLLAQASIKNALHNRRACEEKNRAGYPRFAAAGQPPAAASQALNDRGCASAEQIRTSGIRTLCAC